jgi:kynureninase
LQVGGDMIKRTRFKMDREFVPIQSVERWQLSNAPILSMAAYKASLDMFDEVGMDKLNEKSKVLTAVFRICCWRNQ